MADRHPKKEIQSAIEYALARGRRFLKAGPRAHRYGTLYCSHEGRDGCRIGVYSTPRSPKITPIIFATESTAAAHMQ